MFETFLNIIFCFRSALSPDHSHSHSNSLFLLVIFHWILNIFFLFLFWSKNTPRDGQKHLQMPSREPLGMLFGTSGGAFGLPKRALGALLRRLGRFYTRPFDASKFNTLFNIILKGSGGAKREVLGGQNESKIHQKCNLKKELFFIIVWCILV